MIELPKCRLCDTSPAIYPMADGVTVKFHCNNRKCTLHNVLMTHDQWTALMGGGEAVAWLVSGGRSGKKHVFANLENANLSAYRDECATVTPLYTHPAPAVDDAVRRDDDKIKMQVAQWFATGETGLSGKCMALNIGFRIQGNRDHPHDPADLDRCLKLLEAVPLLRERMPELTTVSPYWAALIANWDEIERSHIDEVGLGWTKASCAPKTYALIRSILDSVREQQSKKGEC